jgi:putative ABC transport system permease protein
MLGIEAVLASVTAAIMGLAVGVVFAWAAVATIPNLVFTVPWSRLALCAVAAGVLGLLASLVPARRAARLSPVVALATE